MTQPWPEPHLHRPGSQTPVRRAHPPQPSKRSNRVETAAAHSAVSEPQQSLPIYHHMPNTCAALRVHQGLRPKMKRATSWSANFHEHGSPDQPQLLPRAAARALVHASPDDPRYYRSGAHFCARFPCVTRSRTREPARPPALPARSTNASSLCVGAPWSKLRGIGKPLMDTNAH
jgi:hypothetical protein